MSLKEYNCLLDSVRLFSLAMEKLLKFHGICGNLLELDVVFSNL